MKVVVLGASSQSTPALFQALAAHPSSFEIEFALAAQNRDRLNSITRAVRVAVGQSFSLTSYGLSQTDLETAVAGADVVLIQIRYGGLAMRKFDESFPLRFNVCGDEGLGPGGLSSAWRSWPPLDDLLGLIEQVNPNTIVLLLTSPLGLLIRMASITHPSLRVIGICELPWTTLHGLAAEGDQAVPAYEYFGINHLGWIYSLESSESPVPLRYLRLHLERADVIREQQFNPGRRTEELKSLARLAMHAYSHGTWNEITAAMASRPAPWYSEAVAPLLVSLIERTSRFHFFLTTRNQNWNASFPPEDILEVPFLWSDGDLVPKSPEKTPPTDLVAILRPFVEYERLAATAILSREHLQVERALEAHPWTNGPAAARGLADAIVAQRLP